MSHRSKKILTLSGLICLMLAMFHVVWSAPYQVIVTRHDFKGEDQELSLKLVQLSDLHLRGFGKHEKAISKQVQALEADVIVLSGDAIDRIEALPWLKEFVDALGNTPVLLIPGNWEHWSQVDFAQLSSTGVTLLLNDEWSLQTPKRLFEIIGMDDFTAGLPDLSLLRPKNNSESGAVKILVQHSPGFFDHVAVVNQMPEKGFDLCLSGHTHGGQIALFGWAPLRPRGSGQYVGGMYETKGCPLYVSRGIGTSVLPIRLGSKPEIVVFEF